MNLWVVGKVNPDSILEWEFQGVFSTPEKAEKACKGPDWFVGPTELDKELPEESAPWPNSYYPYEGWSKR